MVLTSEEVRLVRDVWNTTCSKADGVTELGLDLFIALFTAAPHLQNEFTFAKGKKLDQLRTSPRMKLHVTNFINVIGQAVHNAEHMDTMNEYLHELGSKHVKFGATVDLFEAVKGMLGKELKDRAAQWTPAHEKAWTKFYDQFKVQMVQGFVDAGGK